MTRGMSASRHTVVIGIVVAILLLSRPALAQFTQQGPKLVGSGAVGNAFQGMSVSISADGNTALVGGADDIVFRSSISFSAVGAVWVWTRSGGVWTQQGPKLVGSDAVGRANQGVSVSLSADGNTALVGGDADNSNTGAVWVWTRSAGVWTQQGPKLVGSGGGAFHQGYSVSLSGDGNTALVGGWGSVWVWTRSGSVWTQQGPKLVGSGAVGAAFDGGSVSLSADGNTALVGGYLDNSSAGAAWVWTRSGGVWTQQGPKLVGSGAVGAAFQGWSVSLSADGNTALVGGDADDNYSGAVWVWARSGGIWIQQGPKLVGSGAIGHAEQGNSVSLSANGNTALVGGFQDNSRAGAVWIWTRSGGVWTQQGPKLVGSGAVGAAEQGWSVSLSADGKTALVGGPNDDLATFTAAGAAWVFTRPSAVVAPAVFPLADIDGDGKADLAVWRASTGTWYWLTSSSGYAYGAQGQKQWGDQGLGDVPLTGDIDGDGKTDLIVWRASTGTWYWLTSSSGYAYAAQGQKQWGNQSLGDVPLTGDIDGDGKTDLIVWRASTGTWYWLLSSTSYAYASQGQRQWGDQSLGDVPLLGDMDGDKKADLVVWRASTGTWWWLKSSISFTSGDSRQWGDQSLGDVPLLGDMDGDGKADVVAWRASTGTWWWLKSSIAFTSGDSRQWGDQSLGDVPLLGDMDGDKKADVVAWRASTGTWWWLKSSIAFTSGDSRQWGNQSLGDVPLLAETSRVFDTVVCQLVCHGSNSADRQLRQVRIVGEKK